MVLDLPPDRKDLKVLVTEENLKKVGILTARVGNLIPFYKFRNGAPMKFKPDIRGDAAGNSEESEPEIIAPDGRARPEFCNIYV